ncbi:hypothetical protein ACS0TY_012088 [Phlomoides rotata]
MNRLWKEKYIIFKDANELAPFAEQEQLIRLQTSDVATILELYRASQERLYEDEDTLEKLHDWSSSLLKQHLLNESIPDHKLHNQFKSISSNQEHVSSLFRFPNEDFLKFSRQDFHICQAQQQKELQQLQRWYADCRLDILNYGRDAVRIANFLTSAIFGEPEFSEARLAYAKQIILVTRIDDFFDHAGSREESNRIHDLVQEWEEKSAEEYGSKEVEILFTAVYNTVNNLAEKAHIEQGHCVKPILVKLSLHSQFPAIYGHRIVRRNAIKSRVPGFVPAFFICKERLEKSINSVGLHLAAQKGERAITEEEAKSKIKEMAAYHRRKLMQIVYNEGTVFPRECKDVFLKTCRTGYYLYSSDDEFTSPQQMMEDMKSLVYEPIGTS